MKRKKKKHPPAKDTASLGLVLPSEGGQSLKLKAPLTLEPLNPLVKPSKGSLKAPPKANTGRPSLAPKKESPPGPLAPLEGSDEICSSSGNTDSSDDDMLSGGPHSLKSPPPHTGTASF